MIFSKFSNNFNKDSGILQLMSDLGRAVNLDNDIYMLGGGNPAAIAEVESCFRSEMENLLIAGKEFEKMIGNYDSPQGNQRFIDALAEMLQRSFGWPLSHKNIAITNGSQSSFGVLFNLFAGDYPDGSKKHISLPITPEYIGYNDLGPGVDKLFDASRPLIKFSEDAPNRFYKYNIDFDALALDDRCGAVCVSRPTNPTGNVITDQELNKLSELSNQAGIPLIIDGAYGLPFPNITFTEATPIWDEHIILCLSLSKLGLPGTRTGIVIADPSLIEIISESNAIFNLAPGRFGPTLVTRLVENDALIPLCNKYIRPYYQSRVSHALSVIDEYMADIPVKIHQPEGAIFLWLWFQNLPISSQTLYQNLKQRGVFVIDGQHFFPGLDDNWAHKYQCIRVSYAGDKKQVEQGLKIIAEEARAAYHAVPKSGQRENI